MLSQSSSCLRISYGFLDVQGPKPVVKAPPDSGQISIHWLADWVFPPDWISTGFPPDFGRISARFPLDIRQMLKDICRILPDFGILQKFGGYLVGLLALDIRKTREYPETFLPIPLTKEGIWDCALWLILLSILHQSNGNLLDIWPRPHTCRKTRTFRSRLPRF